MNGPSSLQLFCFSYAGASAAAYLRWRRQLPLWIEVVPIELAGHGRRVSEPLETTMDGAIARIEPLLRPERGRRYALFGHSLGALVAFECARRCEQRGGPSPCALFASGCHAPSQPGTSTLSDDPTDAELITELQRWGGTPPFALSNAELMQLTLPILRADLRVAASYRGQVQSAISTPIHVLAGSLDPLDPAAVRAWHQHTRAEHTVEWFEGGHFFIHERESDVLATLTRRLAPWREPRPGAEATADDR